MAEHYMRIRTCKCQDTSWIQDRNNTVNRLYFLNLCTLCLCLPQEIQHHSDVVVVRNNGKTNLLHQKCHSELLFIILIMSFPFLSIGLCLFIFCFFRASSSFLVHYNLRDFHNLSRGAFVFITDKRNFLTILIPVAKCILSVTFRAY